MQEFTCLNVKIVYKTRYLHKMEIAKLGIYQSDFERLAFRCRLPLDEI